MKHAKKLLALMMVLSMVFSLGVWDTSAAADWFEVTFTDVDNRNYPGTGTEAPGKISYYYAPKAETLIIRGTGALPECDKDHPAPWHSIAKQTKRVILDDGITAISAEAFKDFENLRSVFFPATLKKIAASAFTGCEKIRFIEVVTAVEDAEKLIKESGSIELQKDDIKIIRITMHAIWLDIRSLIRYWLDRVEITRDKSGRPIRIVVHKLDGSTVDTGIKYLNDATAESAVVKNPDTVERRYTVTTTASGEKSATEKEVNDLGQTLVKGDYNLNKNGREVSGIELSVGDDYYGFGTDEKRTLDNAAYYANGSGTKNWTSVDIWGCTTKIIEQVDKNDKILSVKSTAYDEHGILTAKSETTNSYNADGNKVAAITVESDADGSVTSTTDTSYDYNSAKQLTAKTTELTDGDGTVINKLDTTYTYDQSGNLKTETETSSLGNSTVTSYEYTDKGLKKASTSTETFSDGYTYTTVTNYDENERAASESIVTKDSSGNVIFKEDTSFSYNFLHVVSESVTSIVNEDGSTNTITECYDADGRLTGRAMLYVDTEGKKTTNVFSYEYNADGYLISSKQENSYDGKIYASATQTIYDSQGRMLERKTDSVSDGQESSMKDVFVYDGAGRITTEVHENTDPDGVRHGSITTYTYNPDGSYTEKTVPIGEEADSLLAADTLAADTTTEGEGTENDLTADVTETDGEPKEENEVRSSETGSWDESTSGNTALLSKATPNAEEPQAEMQQNDTADEEQPDTSDVKDLDSPALAALTEVKNSEAPQAEEEKQGETPQSEEEKQDEAAQSEEEKQDEAAQSEEEKQGETPQSEEEKQDDISQFVEEKQDEAAQSKEEKQDEAAQSNEEKQVETAQSEEEKQDEAAQSKEEKQVETAQSKEEKQVETAQSEEEKQDETPQTGEEKQVEPLQGEEEKQVEVAQAEEKQVEAPQVEEKSVEATSVQEKQAETPPTVESKPETPPTAATKAETPTHVHVYSHIVVPASDTDDGFEADVCSCGARMNLIVLPRH